ncbi:MAG TPA: sulfite exporter TauE/SafE family protein [Blastocatellia bacterium]|nr:sulfite exporter TauE/SafE family protein [Blastocatellia bacterium]
MEIHLLVGLILSGAIGLSLGLIGGGGSIITVPVLVYVIGVEPHEAISMSLAVVGVTSLIGAAFHSRRGTVRFKTGALFGAAGIAGAFFGSRLTYLLSPAALLLAFAALMIIIAALMLIKKHGARDEARHAPFNLLKAITAGSIVGVLTGFLGVGGGFLIVPALVLFGGLAMKDAIGTSLLVIAINCAAGLAGHLAHGGFSITTASYVTLFAAAGTLAGAQLSHKTSPAMLRKGFAVFVIAVAVFLVAKNYGALVG